LKALQWDADFVPALYQLGNAYRQLNDLDGAKMCLERVLERKPNDLVTMVSLGNVLKEQDDLVGASAAFRKVIAHLPDEPLWELWLSTLCPVVFHSTVGIDQYRANLLARLQSLAEREIAIAPEDITNRGCPPPYNLQFHGRDDRPLKEAYARVFRRCVPGEPVRPGPGKPRVGLVVTDGHEGVFLRYWRGVLERISREAFEPVAICSAAGELRIRAELSAETLPTFVIPSRFDEIVSRIREARFAVLYHWEVGSDVTNYFLPFFRLAPVQCTGAGVPVTTGIPQVDYFLSSDVCEAQRAERDYTERLIRSTSLLTWQRRACLPEKPRGREHFGVGDGHHFYLCPHKIEKFHPDFDGLLGEILQRDPQGILVIPKDRHAYAARKLQNRLRLALPHVSGRIRFVPYQTLEGYFSLVAAADVLLDPIHYGGGLTSFDGFSLAKPIVTMAGTYLRGRFTAGFYRAMKVDGCVARTADEYAEIAVRLAADAEYRRHVEERIREGSDALFEADDSVGEYERILGRLVDEALGA
jgi:predicted O-linked N-acetylglucosamine transferase (SPINDLY family)